MKIPKRKKFVSLADFETRRVKYVVSYKTKLKDYIVMNWKLARLHRRIEKLRRSCDELSRERFWIYATTTETTPQAQETRRLIEQELDALNKENRHEEHTGLG